MLAEEVRVAASTGTADTDWRTETVLSQLWGHCGRPFPRKPVQGSGMSLKGTVMGNSISSAADVPTMTERDNATAFVHSSQQFIRTRGRHLQTQSL
jgi:hypothetical protein